MAVPEQTPYIEHTGNGITTSFALGFQCESKDHLIVLVDDIEPPIATWSLTGGNVVFTTAPAAGKKITLQRNTPFSRTVDYQSYNNSFRPPVVNKDFDWIWWKLQELGVADWILGARIDALKNYVDRKDDELKAYLMEEIRKQGVAIDQLDEYYDYLMERLAQIAVDKGWDSSFVVHKGKTQYEINEFMEAKTLDLLNFFTDAEILEYRRDYTSVDIADAWQRAVFSANYLNQKLTAFGRFRSASTLVLSSHADLSCMILESSATDIAIDVRANDYGYLSRKNIVIGDVVNLNKTSGDKWANTSATGVRTVNLNRCFFKFNRIKDFAVGLDEYAQGNKGSAYNRYELGQFDNNKIQHMLGGENGATVGTSSWVNQNKHDGGSYSHLSAEGSNIPDCHHLYIRPCLFAVNGNTFNDPSFENNACDFHVVNGGRFNYINQARWEIQNGIPKVKYVCETGSASVANHGTRNEIIGGYEAASIQFTYEGTGSAFINVLDTQSRSYFAMDTSSGGKRYSNRFSNNEPVITIFHGTTKRLDAYAANEYNWAFAASKIMGKMTGDEFNRVVIDSQLGYLQLGTGSSSSMATLYGSGTELYVNRSFMPTNTESQDIGKTSAKWKNIHLSGSVGFFGSAPPTTKRSVTGKKSPATIAEQNAVLDSIVSSLVLYGMVTDDRT